MSIILDVPTILPRSWLSAKTIIPAALRARARALLLLIIENVSVSGRYHRRKITWKR